MERVTKLLEGGAPVNWRNHDYNGFTPLHISCHYNKAEVVKVLLRYNPNVNQQKDDGLTALHISCLLGHIDCVKLLLATGQCDQGWCESMCVRMWSIVNVV